MKVHYAVAPRRECGRERKSLTGSNLAHQRLTHPAAFGAMRVAATPRDAVVWRGCSALSSLSWQLAEADLSTRQRCHAFLKSRESSVRVGANLRPAVRLKTKSHADNIRNCCWHVMSVLFCKMYSEKRLCYVCSCFLSSKYLEILDILSEKPPSPRFMTCCLLPGSLIWFYSRTVFDSSMFLILLSPALHPALVRFLDPCTKVSSLYILVLSSEEQEIQDQPELSPLFIRQKAQSSFTNNNLNNMGTSWALKEPNVL